MAFVEIAVQPSSNIKKVEHDADSKTLRITFDKGGTYEYDDVASDTVDSLARAESSGKHFHNYIKGHFQHRKVG